MRQRGLQPELCPPPKWQNLAHLSVIPGRNHNVQKDLSRKRGESIQIDDNIFVTVTEVKGGRVRLSIDAPRSIRIVRQEILERDFPKEAQALALDVPVPAVKCMT